MRDAVEAALSDIILLGTEDQVRLAAQAAADLVAGRGIETAELVVSLRDFIRRVLNLEPVPAGLAIPRQGPTRPAAGGAKGGVARGEGGGGGKGGERGGGAAAGMGMMGLGAGLAADDPHDPRAAHASVQSPVELLRAVLARWTVTSTAQSASSSQYTSRT